MGSSRNEFSRRLCAVVRQNENTEKINVGNKSKKKKTKELGEAQQKHNVQLHKNGVCVCVRAAFDLFFSFRRIVFFPLDFRLFRSQRKIILITLHFAHKIRNHEHDAHKTKNKYKELMEE